MSEAPRRVLCTLLSAAMALLTGGCGAMFSGTSDTVTVHSLPAGAQVYVNDNRIGPTPTSVKVSSKRSHVVQIAAPGYRRATVHVEPEVNAGYVVLDCLLLLVFIVPGVVALVVDASTGGWNEASPDHVGVHLEPAPAVPVAAPVPVAPAAAVPPPPAPQAGCQYDTQCKGERVCVAGACVDPSQRR